MQSFPLGSQNIVELTTSFPFLQHSSMIFVIYRKTDEKAQPVHIPHRLLSLLNSSGEMEGGFCVLGTRLKA